jgi:hypothetical protein
MSRRRRVVAAAALMAGTLLAGLLDASSAGASAAGSANLSLQQTPSNGASSGSTVDKVVVHNAGPDTANALDVTILVKTKSSLGLGLTSNLSTSCQQQPAPTGWTFLFNCQTSSLSAGSNWTLTETYSGTAGVAFTSFQSVGENNPGDPSLKNNSSTLKTYFGPAADLKLAQAVTPGTSSGAVTITDTAKNLGPWTANSLALVIEVNSPGFSNVEASSNLPTSCQFIPPASGFNVAASCTTSSLAPLKNWKVTLSYNGTPGGALEQVGNVTANNPPDPNSANSSATTNTNYAS